MTIKHTKTAIPDVDKVTCVDWNANHTGNLNHQTEITNVTSDQHHPQAHTLASHSTKAHAELTNVTSDQHHAQIHASSHEVGGGDLVDHNQLTNTHNLTTDINHNTITNTHNLTTDINHNTITNTHNLTTDIDHDQLTNFVGDEHINWVVDQSGIPKLIHANNYVDNDTTYTSSDFDHNSLTNTHNLTTDIDHDALTNFAANEHFTQAAISIPASQISDFDTEVSNNTDVAANTLKETNVTTNLSQGTRTATTVDVNSSDGTNATLVEADTTNAGILGSDKWDEIVANTSARHAESHNAASHTDISSTGANIDDAVSKKHSQNTDTDLDATFEATFVKKVDNVNVLADITSPGANIEDAVTKRHSQNTDTILGTDCVALDHGAAATDMVINVSYGTGDPPAANTTTIGSLFVKYTA